MSSIAQQHHNQIVSLLDEAYACRTNNLKRSTELARQALTISTENNLVELKARSLSQLGLFYMIQGEHDLAIQISQQAIEHFTQLNDELGIAGAKYNIAGVYYKTDNYHLGLINLLDCITIYRKHNDYHNLARAHKSLGTVYDYFGDERNAIKTYEDAIAAAKMVGDLNQKSNAYNPLSSIYLKQGDIEKATQMIERSIFLKNQTGDIRGLAFSLYGRGKVYLATKRYTEAEADFLTAVNIHQEMGEKLGLGMVYHRLGMLYVETHQHEKALEFLQKGVEHSYAYQLVMVRFKCFYQYYHLYKQQNKPVEALHYLELYLKEKETVINTQTLKVIENYELLSRMDTVRKEAQMQLERAEMIEKKNLAEQAARVKQDFLSTMSHEIRTPLNAVITIASLLADKAAKEEQELISALRFASNNLLLLINDILDFTKLEVGKSELEIHPTRFIKLLENIRSTYINLANEKGLAFTLTIGEGVADSYLMDETKISQILGNLVTNAIKFTQQGSVNIIIEKISAQAQNDTLKFTIQDTGQGISADHLETIFDSFSQPKSITTKKQSGSGLGLAIVKKLVELHNSTVKVSSAVGTGSSFSFEITAARSSQPTEIKAKFSTLLSGKRVLIAEDNLINAMVLTKLLRNWSMTADHAKNGLEAVEKANQEAFDFILMDIHMPEMDGFEATKQITGKPNPNTDTPVFALTADITAEYQADYRPYFTGFLRKPIEVDKLHDSLVAHLKG